MQNLLSAEEQRPTDTGRQTDDERCVVGDAQNGPTASSSTSSRRHVLTGARRSSSVSVRQRYEPRVRVDRLLTDVQSSLQRQERRMMLRDYLDTVRFEWQEVALVVDRTLLLTFVLVTFAATVIILLHAPLATQFLFGHHSVADDHQSPTDSGQTTA